MFTGFLSLYMYSSVRKTIGDVRLHKLHLLHGMREGGRREQRLDIWG